MMKTKTMRNKYKYSTIKRGGMNAQTKTIKKRLKPKVKLIIEDEDDEKEKEKEKETDIKISQPEQQQEIEMVNQRWNEQFIYVLEKLHEIMMKQGEPFRARAYKKAQETIMSYPNDIVSVDQIKDLPGIGKTIESKLGEYVETGTLKVLEREKNNPVNILADVYGIGPKKAKELVDNGITSIAILREKQDQYLNDVQKVGLKYYEQIEKKA